MSRDFEKEYIALANEEIPDLWDRIEAGLCEKTAPEKEQISKVKPVILWKKYAGLAAAVLCAAIVIPAFMFTRRMNKSASFESAAPAEAAQQTEECAVQEESAGAVYDTTGQLYEIAEGGADSMEETVEDTKEICNDNAAPEAAYEEAGVEDLNEGTNTEEKESVFRKEEAASGAQDQRGTLILENITVQVTREKNVDAVEADKEENSMEGELYRAIVIYDPSGTFAADEQIEIYIYAAYMSDMIVGKECKIDIVCDEDGEYPFVVENISPLLNETGQ